MKANRILLALLWAWVAACSSKEPQATDKASAGSAAPTAKAGGEGSAAAPPARAAVEQIAPPLDVKAPPADATKLPSGMSFVRLTTTDGPTPGKNDTVNVHFTGWKVATGETFNTTRTRNVPMPLDLAMAGPGFADVFTQVRKGEKIMMWMPAEIVAKNGQGAAEALAFEAELIEIKAAPQIPPDVAAPPATAKAGRGGVRQLVVAPGKGTERARAFDTVSFHYSMWDATGRMVASTEVGGRAVSSFLFRQPRLFEQVLAGMVVGQRVRLWAEAAQIENLREMVRVGGQAPTGTLCLEIALAEILKGPTPPAVPPDVKAPPPGAKKTASGVSYRVLAAGKGTAHPTATDSVRVHYSGWTTDGRLFDSSLSRGEPAVFSLSGVIKGWTDGIATMVAGERTRFWIPASLAYEGQPDKPQGMLVFDVELLEIVPASPPDPHGAHDGHGH